MPGTDPGEGCPGLGWTLRVRRRGAGAGAAAGSGVRRCPGACAVASPAARCGRWLMGEACSPRSGRSGGRTGRDHPAPALLPGAIHAGFCRGWPTSRTCAAPPQLRRVDRRGPTPSWHLRSSRFLQVKQLQRGRCTAGRPKARRGHGKQQPILQTAAAPATRPACSGDATSEVDRGVVAAGS